jgi:hypothetical protein
MSCLVSARFSRKRWVREEAMKLSARWAKIWGPVLVFRRLWEELGLPEMFSGLVSGTGVTTDFEEAAFAMVLNRLLDPRSKLATWEWMNTIYRPEWDGLELHHLYRTLDFLALRKDQIEKALYARVRSVFDLSLDLVLWDTTTTYFEGRACEGLAEYGFSKDKRPDRLQIMIGVLMSWDGFPLAHQVFPGNTAEVNTFREALRQVRERFHLRKVILVADRGMVAEKVLEEIEEAGLEYIVGVRMRKARAAKAILARPGRYHEVDHNLKVKEVIHERVRYVICLNPEEQERDRLARQEVVTRLKEKLALNETIQFTPLQFLQPPQVGHYFLTYLAAHPLAGDKLQVGTRTAIFVVKYFGPHKHGI